MCGRYYIADDDLEDMRAWIMEAGARAAAANVTLRTGEIFPSATVPVIANSRSMKPGAFPMQWGMRHGDKKAFVINARSETAATKSMFAESTKTRRCIVPASWYYEWGRLDKTTREKHQYGFASADEGLLYMAGLYALDETGGVARFVILTRPASEAAARIHHRMPVLLPKDVIKEWLSPEAVYAELLHLAIDDVNCWDATVA